MYAIVGDVHGCIRSLEALLAALPAGVTPVFVGDLIDRGPADADVIDLVRDSGFPCVMGNHEHFAVDAFLGTGIYQWGWWEQGSGGKGVSYFGESRLEWMSQLPLFLEFMEQDEQGMALFVSHAAVKHDLKHATDHDRLMNSRWDNDTLLWYRGNPGRNMPRRFQVFGHTPVRSVKLTDRFANVDTGCIYGYTRKETGRTLSALLWPSKEVVSVPFQD